MGATCSNPFVSAQSRRAAEEQKERTMEQTVAKVMGILRTADEPGLALRNRIRDAVETKGWTEEIAQRILASLEQFIEQGAETMGEAMFAAMNTASKTVYDIFDFGKEHLTAVIGTLVAIGVLAILAPSVIEMLGFAELGPTEGTFAARWQSMHGGYIPKGSLFSFFQRLGMKWPRC